jgi:ribonuclease P protein component
MNIFSKPERLSSRKSVEKLFSSGNRLFHFPFMLIWRDSAGDERYPVKILIGVSRRKFRKAVDRNRVKRLIRECYRINKHILTGNLTRQNRNIEMAIVYTAGQIYDFQYLEKKLTELLSKFHPDDPPDKDIL